jgi:hypothetical protein
VYHAAQVSGRNPLYSRDSEAEAMQDSRDSEAEAMQAKVLTGGRGAANRHQRRQAAGTAATRGLTWLADSESHGRGYVSMNNVVLPAIPEGFGRGAEKLADTVRHVVDLIAGPDRIRAKAQAQADAEAYAMVVVAEGRAMAQDIEARALTRLRKRETRRQANIESITEKALDALPPPEQMSEQPVNEDWTSRFFEECQDIADEQMQQIWAKILAGEVVRPGSF